MSKIDLPTKLCSWQKRCARCSSGILLLQTQHGMTKGLTSQLCPSCGGTGLVYVLDDSVRAPCKDCIATGKAHRRKPSGIALAGAWYEIEPTTKPCPSWTPSTDLEVWLLSLYTANFWFQIMVSPDDAIAAITIIYRGRVGQSYRWGLDGVQSALEQIMDAGVP